MPAQHLHESFGFEYCQAFGEYTEDPNSVDMSVRLAPEPEC